MKRTLLVIAALCCSFHLIAQQTVGLFTQKAGAEDGYVLFSPVFSKDVFLIDKCGRQVHNWTSRFNPGVSVYLLPDGSLMRPGNSANPIFNYGGTGGIIEKFSWDNDLLWEYPISDGLQCQHHDICPLPNGNVLAIVWELKTLPEALSAGRDPSKAAEVWSEKIVELRPMPPNNAEIVWEWHIWDHLVQDVSPAAMNWGVPSDHPELLDVNYAVTASNPDWLHVNSVAYNADLDQIMLSSYYFDELWVIDHSTTTMEAASHTGGRSGKGGDLLYRWGNPQAYGRGKAADKRLFVQHDAHWIPNGYRDAGKIMVFNNGQMRPDGNYNSIDVIAPPVDALGNYSIATGAAFGPNMPFWSYTDSVKENFYSPIMSGASRLPGGNTLITESTKGNLFEVDTFGKIVWQYINPVGAGGTPVSQGTAPVQPMVFRAYQYPVNYAGFTGRPLTPGLPIELNPLTYTCYVAPPPPPIDLGVSGKGLTTGDYIVTNPFGKDITLRSSVQDHDARLTLVNSLGVQCAQWNTQIQKGAATTITIPQTLPAGVYLLRINNGRSESVVRLIHQL